MASVMHALVGYIYLLYQLYMITLLKKGWYVAWRPPYHIHTCLVSASFLLEARLYKRYLGKIMQYPMRNSMYNQMCRYAIVAMYIYIHIYISRESCSANGVYRCYRDRLITNLNPNSEYTPHACVRSHICDSVYYIIYSFSVLRSGSFVFITYIYLFQQVPVIRCFGPGRYNDRELALSLQQLFLYYANYTMHVNL
jgi:hypothetical protein